MKRNLLYLLMLVGIMSVFTACSDDKDEPNIPIEKEVAGTYKGALDIVMNGAPLANGLPKNISISKAGVSTINLELKDFSFMGQNLGDIIISDCRMLKYRDHYTFSGAQALTLPTIGECKVVADGTLIGNDITVNLDIAVTQLGQTVKVTFAGAKLLGNESSEAEITNFILESDVVTGQPIINQSTGKISFRVNEEATDEELKLAPIFTISEKATVFPASGIVQDFSKGKSIVYTVVAENGEVKQYTVSVDGVNQITVYDFETWVLGIKGQKPENTFYEVDGWKSSNTGAHLLKTFKQADSYVVTQTEDAHSGSLAARIESIDTKGKNLGIALVPKVTTGSLFLGDFITDMKNTLNSTKFGIPYNRKPISLKGFYKYIPGKTYYKCESIETCHQAKEDPNATDECAINIVIYETEKHEADWSDCLTGVPDVEKNIYTSSRVVAIGSFDSGEQKDWKEFNIRLEYKKEFNPAMKYRMTIACSSSKFGDKFWGAPGSVLTVDDFELMAE